MSAIPQRRANATDEALIVSQALPNYSLPFTLRISSDWSQQLLGMTQQALVPLVSSITRDYILPEGYGISFGLIDAPSAEWTSIWAGPPSSQSSESATSTRATTGTPWYDEPGLEGMGLAVQQTKRIARRVCAEVEFGAPEVAHVNLDDEQDAELVFAELRVYLPSASDDHAFRDAFFAALGDELSADNARRLAVQVVRARD